MKNEVNEIKISYCEKLGVFDSKSPCDSTHVAQLLHETWNKDTLGLQETFKVLLLNHSNKIKGIVQ